MKKCILLINLVMVDLLAVAQPQIQKITPLNPDVAAIEKYGDMPVGHFTGIPTVGIPIYTINSKSLSLPLSLNYHAGGNKVEDVSSWVGLGWSISVIPSISRKINSLPDESTGGYFTKYHGLYTAEKMYDSVMATSGISSDADYIQSIYAGEADTEADIFTFNLPNKSGKFFWNQETERFYVTPWQNIKVEGNGYGFEITDDDGTIYFFYTKEVSEGVATSWMVDKMYNANFTDSLIFSYNSSNQIIKTLNSQSKLIWGDDCGATMNTISTSTTTAYNITSIYFNGGQVNFNRDTAGRQDLNGGYSLKDIKVYNSDGNLIKELAFSYSYRSSGANYEDKRLILDSVRNKEPGGTTYQKHSFLYDSTIAIPSRLSYAQDYWGFYNGTYNTGLAPTGYLNISSSVVVSAGANRNVRPDYTQFAILKRIYYPTGGFTDFEYENNTARNPGVPPEYRGGLAMLNGDGGIPPVSYYETDFEIDNPPNSFLNGGLGGAYINIQAGAMACISCSSLRIIGLDPANSHINITVSGNSDRHLPNGHYQMTADFGTQDLEDYLDFHFIVSWYQNDTVVVNSKVGGLRVKAIKSYDGYGNTLIKSYRYTTSLASDTTSGDIFAQPYFLGYENYTCVDYIGGLYIDRQSYRIVASPLATQVSHSGSVAGYKTVYEFVDSAGVLGVNEYKFSHAADMITPGSPFPPPYSMEAFRGQLLEHNVFRKNENGYFPIKRTIYEYTSKTFDSLASFSFKTRLNREPVYNFGSMTQLPTYDHVTYENIPHWVQQSRKTDVVYDASDTTKYLTTVTDYEYYDSLYQLYQTKYVDSRNDTIKTRFYYPANLSLAGAAEVARVLLVNQHSTQTVLKQEVYRNSILINEAVTNYRYFDGIVMPDELFQKIGIGLSESKIKFLGYSIQGNLLAQQKTNDVIQTYIWGYNSKYPIAEIINADSLSIAYSSFETVEKGGWTYSASAISDVTSPTGGKCYLASSGSITKSGLTSRTYIISYWGKNGSVAVNGSGPTRTGKTIGSWTYYEHEVTGTAITLSGSNYIDELRLYPRGAQMKTFAYKPLIGMISQCDATNRILYYEYDNFNRLKIIRDEDGRILKRMDYQYQVANNQ